MAMVKIESFVDQHQTEHHHIQTDSFHVWVNPSSRYLWKYDNIHNIIDQVGPHKYLIFLSYIHISSMDYRGQRLSERIHYILVILFGAVAWIVGFYYTDFELTFNGWYVGISSKFSFIFVVMNIFLLPHLSHRFLTSSLRSVAQAHWTRLITTGSNPS